jgi:hypothetical protein
LNPELRACSANVWESLAEIRGQELPTPNLFAPILPVEYYRKTSHHNNTPPTNQKLVLGRKKKNKPENYPE